MLVCQSHHNRTSQTGWLTQQQCLLSHLWSKKSKFKMLAGLVPSKGGKGECVLGLSPNSRWFAYHYLVPWLMNNTCLQRHMAFFLCTCLYVQISTLPEDTSNIGLELTLLNSYWQLISTTTLVGEGEYNSILIVTKDTGRLLEIFCPISTTFVSFILGQSWVRRCWDMLGNKLIHNLI